MKSCYYEKIGETNLSIADLCDYYDLGMMITRINVPKSFRGEGRGSRLLRQITNDADKTGTVLFLEILPSDGLNYEELKAWYIRHGFQPWKGIFRRKPNS